jgi:hypothetical protein
MRYALSARSDPPDLTIGMEQRDGASSALRKAAIIEEEAKGCALAMYRSEKIKRRLRRLETSSTYLYYSMYKIWS